MILQTAMPESDNPLTLFDSLEIPVRLSYGVSISPAPSLFARCLPQE